MYRDEVESLRAAVARLEAELAELRVLPRRRRRGLLASLAALGLVIVLLSMVACFAARTRADTYEAGYDRVLDERHESQLALASGGHQLAACLTRAYDAEVARDRTSQTLSACSCHPFEPVLLGTPVPDADAVARENAKLCGSSSKKELEELTRMCGFLLP
jgi:hypothetical protein